MKIGQRVYATHGINENDWWDMAWDDPDNDPWHISKGTEGTIKGFDGDAPGFCVVDFDNGIHDVCVCYEDGEWSEVALTQAEIDKAKREKEESERRRYNDPAKYSNRLL